MKGVVGLPRLGLVPASMTGFTRPGAKPTENLPGNLEISEIRDLAMKLFQIRGRAKARIARFFLGRKPALLLTSESHEEQQQNRSSRSPHVQRTTITPL